MKKGDWVELVSTGEVGQLVVEDYLPRDVGGRWHLIMRKGHGVNTLRPEYDLMPFDSAVGDILTAVNNHKE